jgi:hypothetical protein
MPHRIVVREDDSASLAGAALAPTAVGSPGWDRGSADEAPSARHRLYSGLAGRTAQQPGGVRAALPAQPPWPDGADGPAIPQQAQQTAEPSWPGQAAAGAHHGLPRRLRQASLAPQLRDNPPADAASSRGTHDARSADQARALIASIQQGWRNGRAAADQPGTGAQGTPQDTNPESTN